MMDESRQSMATFSALLAAPLSDTRTLYVGWSDFWAEEKPQFQNLTFGAQGLRKFVTSPLKSTKQILFKHFVYLSRGRMSSIFSLKAKTEEKLTFFFAIFKIPVIF